MGRYSKGANGTISGKVGSVVGAKWRSIRYLRSLPSKSSKPASEKQLAVQARFMLAARQLRPIKDVLNLGFSDKKLNKITGYNAAVKNFINNAITGNYPDYSIDFSKFQLSNGSLSPLTTPACSVGVNELRMSWQSKPNRFSAFADDEVVALVYNETAKVYSIDDTAMRSEQIIVFTPSASAGDVLHVWVFAVNRDGDMVSPSQYVGQLIYTVES